MRTTAFYSLIGVYLFSTVTVASSNNISSTGSTNSASGSVAAGSLVNVGAVHCPTPHPKYSDILKTLEGLSASFKEKEDCKSIATEIDELHKKYQDGNRSLIDPARNLGEAKIKEKKELTIDEVKNLTEYSEKVTSSIGAIIQKLQSKPYCLAEKNTSALIALADIVQETTGIASKYTGPFDIAISVGGAAISGILRGINYLIDKQSGGVDFRDREQRKLFVSSLCSYHNVRGEIEDLISPEKRMSELERTKNALIEKRKLFLDPRADHNRDGKPDNCELCTDIDAFCTAKKSLERSFVSGVHLLNNIKNLISIEGKEWDTCMAINDFAEPDKDYNVNVSSVKVAKAEFERFVMTLNEIKTIPNFQKCMSFKDSKELRQQNYRSLAIVEYIGATSKNTFKVALDETIKKGYKKYVEEEKWERNPVEHTAITLSKLDWVSDEIVSLTGMSNGGSAQIQREINDINLYLRNMYFVKLAPDFLNWHKNDVYESLDRFENSSENVSKEFKKILKMNTGMFTSNKAAEIPPLLKRIIKAKDVQHAYVYSLLKQLLLELNTAKKSFEAIHVYCQFFKDSYTLTPEIQNICLDKNIKEIEGQLNRQKQIVDSVESYMQWGTKENKFPSDKIEELLKRVSDYRNSVKIIE